MTDPNFIEEPLDFSLVVGGPIFQLFRRSHLTGDGLELLHRRVLIIMAVAWAPLLILTIAQGFLAGNVGRLSFLHDFEVHVRFLIALPALIAVELMVHARTRPVVRCFVERRLVLPEDRRQFNNAIQAAVRRQNSIPVEIGLLILVYTVGLWLPSGPAQGFDLVRQSRWALESYPCRFLVRFRQHPHPTVHPSALVHEAPHLVSFSVACLQNQPEPHSNSP